MTLVELRYIVALARERHFGRAAEACYVSQPTLSVAVKKLEEQLGVTLFERRGTETKSGSVRAVSITPIGEQIVAQAERVLAEAARINEIATQGKDPLAGPLRLGVIYTIAPYLLPKLVPLLRSAAPQMPLIVQENFTGRLVEQVRAGDLDLIIVALPLNLPSLMEREVYDEAFRVLIPAAHPWVQQTRIKPAWLLDEPLLLLGAGNCFRDQVLDLCARTGNSGVSGVSFSNPNSPHILEGSSLETIRYMVASGIGITVMPATAADLIPAGDPLLCVRPFVEPTPTRCVGLVWRSSYPRQPVVDIVRQAMIDCRLPGTEETIC